MSDNNIFFDKNNPNDEDFIFKDAALVTPEPSFENESFTYTEPIIETKPSINLGLLIENQTSDQEQEQPKKNKFGTYELMRLVFFIGFLVFTFLLINNKVIQPYQMRELNERINEMYVAPIHIPINNTPTDSPVGNSTDAPATLTPDPNRDLQGRLLTFKDLLEANQDTKGWLEFPDTNINYVVMQKNSDSIYYLSHNFENNIDKGGALFLDQHSSVEKNTKNMVIHGHNMKTTDNMFHNLEHMKKLDYFMQHSTFDFNTIFQTGQWKIFSIFITNGSDKKEPFFDYTRATFKDSSDFMNFVYQLRIRSIFNIDTVDINENDQILELSTCTYELDNYRLVLVARKVRSGEDPSMDTSGITKNKSAVYPQSYYDFYKITAPKLPATFEEALKDGTISWYGEKTIK